MTSSRPTPERFIIQELQAPAYFCFSHYKSPCCVTECKNAKAYCVIIPDTVAIKLEEMLGCKLKRTLRTPSFKEYFCKQHGKEVKRNAETLLQARNDVALPSQVNPHSDRLKTLLTDQNPANRPLDATASMGPPSTAPHYYYMCTDKQTDDCERGSGPYPTKPGFQPGTPLPSCDGCQKPRTLYCNGSPVCRSDQCSKVPSRNNGYCTGCSRSLASGGAPHTTACKSCGYPSSHCSCTPLQKGEIFKVYMCLSGDAYGCGARIQMQAPADGRSMPQCLECRRFMILDADQTSPAGGAITARNPEALAPVWVVEGPLPPLPPLPPSTLLAAASAPPTADNALLVAAKKLDPPLPSDDPDCCICLDSKATHIFSPCGHQCVCENFSQDPSIKTNGTCPICRAPFQNVIKVFK
jgi:hypothetical protein